MSTVGEISEFDGYEFSVSTNQLNSAPESLKSLKSAKTAKSSGSVDKIWADKKIYKSDDSYSEVSDCDSFLARGSFLLTPSHELTIDRAALICEKMTFKGYYR